MVEGEAQPKQQPALEHPRGDAGVPHRPEQDGVVSPQLSKHVVRKGFSGTAPGVRTQVVVGRLDGHTLRGDRGVEHPHRLGHDLGTDPVAADHGDLEPVAHPGSLRPG